MKKTKGIVMRTSPKVTVIFTKGVFLEIPTPKVLPIVGQVIEVPIKPRQLSLFRKSVMKYASTAAVLFLVLSISVFYLFIPNMAVASVALDINKGIELLINKDGKVIRAQDVNGGSSLVEGISIQGLDAYQAVDLILENANHKGTLNETKNLILATIVPINQWGTTLINTEKLRHSIRDEMTRRNIYGSVVVSQGNQEIQQQAKQLGMTVNSYLIYNQCEENGIAVQADSVRNDAQKALADAKVSASSLFPEECYEVKARNRKDGSTDTQEGAAGKNSPENKGPSNGTGDGLGDGSGSGSGDGTEWFRGWFGEWFR